MPPRPATGLGVDRQAPCPCSSLQLGAHVSLTMSPQTTHVVCRVAGTEKARQARARGIHTVAISWLEEAGERPSGATPSRAPASLCVTRGDRARTLRLDCAAGFRLQWPDEKKHPPPQSDPYRTPRERSISVKVPSLAPGGAVAEATTSPGVAITPALVSGDRSQPTASGRPASRLQNSAVDEAVADEAASNPDLPGDLVA